MRYEIIEPPEPLRLVVKCFWVLVSDYDDRLPNEHILMADGSADWVIHLHAGFREYRAMPHYVSGPHALFRRLTPMPGFGLLGVRMHNHAIHQIVDCPVSEVTNKVVDASIVLRGSNGVYERLLNTLDTSGQVGIMSAYLTAELARRSNNPFSRLVREITDSKGLADISAVRAKTGLSARQFERRFKQVAGLSAKHLNRLVRFEVARRYLAARNFPRLSDVGHAANYYDQSHFIRDFHEFGGMHPGRYRTLLATDVLAATIARFAKCRSASSLTANDQSNAIAR